MTIISAKNLSKDYILRKNIFTCVEDISFDIEEKEFITIMGPSGCGKSTLLKMIAGLESVSSGSLFLHGEDCSHSYPDEMKKRIGFMYQNENLLLWRTVEKNLRVPLEIFKMVDENTPKQIEEVLSLVGLSDYADVLPNELSGGMKQRVGIARALVYSPDIVIMDQPLGALDAITRNMLAYDFLRIWQETKKTFIMTTNSVDEAILCSTRIFYLTETPASIREVIKVDIPIEKRDEHIQQLPEFWELRNHVQDLIKHHKS